MLRVTAVARLASAASPTPHQIAREARIDAACAASETSEFGDAAFPGPRAALATSASSIVTTRMTSTPSRKIVTSDATNAGPNAPTGRLSSRLTTASTAVDSDSTRAANLSPLSPAARSPRSALNWISSGRTDWGLRRKDSARAARTPSCRRC